MSKSLAIIEKEIKPLTKALTITGPKDMVIADARRADLKAIIKRMKTEKDKVLGPLNEARKAEMARWKPAEEAAENSLQLINNEMSRYQTEERRVADEKAAKIAARVGHGKGKLHIETAMQQIDGIDRPQSNVGGTGFTTVKKFEVMDVNMLPIAYVLPDEVAIRAAMHRGEQLPGVRYWEEQRPKSI